MINVITNEKLKEWFAPNWFVPCRDANIYTMGSMPIDEASFDLILRASGLEISELSEHTDVLIIGHEDFNEEAVEELLDLREGKDLRVYSQEMFLAHWATRQDPFDDEEVVEAFAEDHAGLQFLQNCWVDWVSTEVSLSPVTGDNKNRFDAPETSVLKEMGYTVGKTKGLPAPARHRILDIVFNSKLKTILSPQYIRYCRTHYPHYLDDWGAPKSRERLEKMRDFISSLCRQQKRRGNEAAAADYDEDLRWLDLAFRTGRFKFNLTRASVS